jgi:threonine dehydratase
VAGCKAYGAEVEMIEDIHDAFERVREIEAEEGRSFIHPFEGEMTVLGTATVGLELCTQVSELDAVIVPIGGGGLCAGIATAVKLMQLRQRPAGVHRQGSHHRRQPGRTPCCAL